MRQKKRIVRLLELFLLCVLLTLPVNAAGMTVSINAPKNLPEVGETFTVTVEISDNPSLCSAQYTLTFDQNIVSCEKASVGKVLSGTLSATNPKAESGAIVAAATATPVEGDGSIGEFTFKVLAKGTTTFSLEDCVFIDADNQQIQPNVSSVSVGTANSIEPEEKSDKVESDEKNESTKTEPDEPENESELTQPENPSESKAQTFSDVPKSFWGYEYIETAASKGFVNGMADGTFDPDRDMTRAEFVTMLYRMAGKLAVSQAASFSDVSADDWYSDAVNWAASKSLVNGTSETTFDLNGKVTRQEAMTILFRYSGGASGMEAMLTGIYDSQFSDSETIAPWAKQAVYWAVYNKIVNGTTDTTISPLGTATRAQIAAILVRYCG